MSIEECIKVLDEIAEGFERLSAEVCARTDLRAMWKGRANGVRQAIALIKAHLMGRPNDPLTLEELRVMDGEPVWVDTTDIKKANRWAFVDVGCEVVRFFDTRYGVKCSVMGNNFRTYGKNWLAYRRKPEEETMYG